MAAESSNEEESLEARMLAAAELFHYSYRFRDQLFVIAVEQAEVLHELLQDLRVLQTSHIKVLICCPASPKLINFIDEWNARGFRFCSFATLEPDLITERLEDEQLPVITLKSSLSKDSVISSPFHQEALEIASVMGAEKAFLLSDYPALVVDGKYRSFTTPKEIDRYLAEDAKINIGAEALSFLREQQQSREFDVAILEAKEGALFQEIFTHMGVGTLFSSHYPNVFRVCTLKDLSDLTFLMKPYVASGAILPISEEQLVEEIESFYAFTVNGEIVASAKLREYPGKIFEIGKVCTLPRYRRQGRARTLAENILSVNQLQDAQFAFAVSIEPHMWDFFKGLGFVEIDREKLPEEWQKGYDFSRPSKAFKYSLKL